MRKGKRTEGRYGRGEERRVGRKRTGENVGGGLK
jgi:hypothetical protein